MENVFFYFVRAPSRNYGHCNGFRKVHLKLYDRAYPALGQMTPQELYRWGKHCLGVKKFECLFVVMVVSVSMFVCVFLSVGARICMYMLHMFPELVEGRAKGGGRGDG